MIGERKLSSFYEFIKEENGQKEDKSLLGENAQQIKERRANQINIFPLFDK